MANAGRILLMPKGTWTANTEYSPLDFVYFGGNSFVCKYAVSGTIDPTNDTAHWQQMASGFDSDLITQTITNEPNHIASDAAVYAEVKRLEADFAQIEETTTASKAYVVGDYFTYGGTLYIVTDNIIEGGTIIPGANCEETSIGERIESIELRKFNVANVVNNLTTTSSGYALDARQGKALNDRYGRFIQHNLRNNMGSAMTILGNQFLWLIGDIAVLRLCFYVSAAQSSGTLVCTLPTGYTYTFMNNVASNVWGSETNVTTLNISDAGAVTLGAPLSANGHVEFTLIGRAIAN